jgi:hypothetical protein
MEFANDTRFPADLLRTALDEERLSASVLARVTYDIHGDRLVPSEAQPWIVSREPWMSPHGPFENDQPFRTAGCDVFVFGYAYAPGGRAAVASMVSVIVGDFRRDVRVTGARTWTRTGGVLVPGNPQTFETVPLTLQYAFGGKSLWDELEVPWPDNPDGLGFHVDERLAEGAPLPMLEDPAHLVRKWDDRPPVVGFGLCPLHAGPRVRSAVEFDAAERRIVRVKPNMLNAAYPELVVPAVAPGTVVRLLGVTKAGQLEFRLPDRPPQATIQLGEDSHDRALEIDQIGIDVEAGSAFVTYRFPFRYRFVREQQRRVRLVHPEA